MENINFEFEVETTAVYISKRSGVIPSVIKEKLKNTLQTIDIGQSFIVPVLLGNVPYASLGNEINKQLKEIIKFYDNQKIKIDFLKVHYKERPTTATAGYDVSDPILEKGFIRIWRTK